MPAFSTGGGAETRARAGGAAQPPAAPGGRGRMLAAVIARELTFPGGSSEECELSLQALAGGELLAADNVDLAIVAVTKLARADRDEARAA